MSRLIFAEECYRIIGACFNVYKQMGCGFLESVYQECLEIELDFQRIPFTPQREFKIFYRDRELKKKFRPDFSCYDEIIIELKAVSALTSKHESQVINYLNATDIELGVLVNFGHFPKVEFKRIILTDDKKRKLRNCYKG